MHVLLPRTVKLAAATIFSDEGRLYPSLREFKQVVSTPKVSSCASPFLHRVVLELSRRRKCFAPADCRRRTGAVLAANWTLRGRVKRVVGVL